MGKLSKRLILAGCILLAASMIYLFFVAPKGPAGFGTLLLWVVSGLISYLPIISGLLIDMKKRKEVVYPHKKILTAFTIYMCFMTLFMLGTLVYCLITLLQ